MQKRARIGLLKRKASLPSMNKKGVWLTEGTTAIRREGINTEQLHKPTPASTKGIGQAVFTSS